MSSVGVASALSLLFIVIDVVSEGDWHLPRGKSRSILGVRSNCLCRLLSERGGVVVLVVMVRFLGLKFNAMDSSEASRITGRYFRRRESNKGDLGGIFDEGEGSGC